MGRRGYVMTRQPEYGTCISDWAQTAFYDYLTRHGLEVSSAGDEFVNTEDADHWEIAIPYDGRRKPDKDGNRPHNYDKIRRLIADLREHPDRVAGDDGSPHGEAAADVLEQGLDAALKYKYDYIMVDWW